MGYPVRPKITKKREYYIPRNRYYELKYFCLQYDEWKKELLAITPYAYSKLDISHSSASGKHSDPTEQAVEKRDIYARRIEMIERAAYATDPVLAKYILAAVTKDYSYGYLQTVMGIPCSSRTYYRYYHLFFWYLDRERE